MEGMQKNTYIIAEAGVNHNGQIQQAKKLVDIAVQAKADAVKFQIFSADTLATKKVKQAEYQKSSINEQSQYEMLRQLELSKQDFLVLKEYCFKKNIDFLVTPFDNDSLQFLYDKCNLKKIKISSGDLTNSPFVLQIAQTGLPIILSTGMATIGEIEKALAVIAYGYKHMTNNIEDFSWSKAYESLVSKEGQKHLQQNVILLHCTTEYPAPIDEVNLRAMQTLYQTFLIPVGYSDHTEGISIPIAAVALGATIIEKHFTLDKRLVGPDHKVSLEPNELKEMVSSIRKIEKALGTGIKLPSEKEMRNRSVVRKSIVAACDIDKGSMLSKRNLEMKRAGEGLSPELYWDIVNHRAEKRYEKDEII